MGILSCRIQKPLNIGILSFGLGAAKSVAWLFFSLPSRPAAVFVSLMRSEVRQACLGRPSYLQYWGPPSSLPNMPNWFWSMQQWVFVCRSSFWNGGGKERCYISGENTFLWLALLALLNVIAKNFLKAYFDRRWDFLELLLWPWEHQQPTKIYRYTLPKKAK